MSISVGRFPARFEEAHEVALPAEDFRADSQRRQAARPPTPGGRAGNAVTVEEKVQGQGTVLGIGCSGVAHRKISPFSFAHGVHAEVARQVVVHVVASEPYEFSRDPEEANSPCSHQRIYGSSGHVEVSGNLLFRQVAVRRVVEAHAGFGLRE